MRLSVMLCAILLPISITPVTEGLVGAAVALPGPIAMIRKKGEKSNHTERYTANNTKITHKIKYMKIKILTLIIIMI